MTPDQLLTALEQRRQAIQAAWLKALPTPGSPAYATWLAAYGQVAERIARAHVWLRMPTL